MGGQLIGPFQAQADEPELPHEGPDNQGVLPDPVHFAEQQQAAESSER